MRALLLLALAALGGCSTLYTTPKVEVAEPTTALPQVQPAPQVNNGAIFQASQYRPLFEDHRARLVGTGSASNTFSGKGTTENSNDFSGTITATVTGVLPNGHLLVAGEKQIGVNQNVDVLRFSGQIDPRAIQPGNTVASAQIANVRIEQRGRGQQADAQAMGWLARFFLNILPI